MSRTQTLIPAPDKSGRIMGVNIARLAEFPFFLLSNPNSNSISFSANQSSAPVIAGVSGEGPMIITALSKQNTGACTCTLQIEDGKRIISLMNAPVNVATLFGNNGQPFYLPEALFIAENQSIVVRLTDISGSSNTFRPCFWGTRYTTIRFDPTLQRMKQRMQEKMYLTYPFFYTLLPTNTVGQTVGAVSLAGNATSTQDVEISNGNHFELITISATATSPLFNINIVDAETGESLIDAPQANNYAISSAILAGSGNFPFRFHEPRLFKAGTRLTITLTDYSGSTNNIFLTLGGRHIATRMWQ